MTAAFSERDWDRIYNATWQEFVTFPAIQTVGSKRNKFREKRSGQVAATINNFRAAMESDNPPQSKEEAVRQVAGLLRRILGALSWVFPQYSILIQIIGFLWDVSTGQNVTIAGVASAEAHN